MKDSYNETDLYGPVRSFFEQRGWQVHGEVRSCDIAAQKEDELMLIELKKKFTLQLVYQALDRKSMADMVFVAIPRPVKNEARTLGRIRNLLEHLEIGLITVAMDSPGRWTEVIYSPRGNTWKQNVKKKQLLLKELQGRQTGDHNSGGGQRKKLVTAYRERAIRTACILDNTGPMSAAQLRQQYGCEMDTYQILHGNPYGWFESRGRGKYMLTDQGREEIWNEFRPVAACWQQELFPSEAESKEEDHQS